MRRYQRTVHHQSGNYRKNNIAISKKTRKTNQPKRNRLVITTIVAIAFVVLFYQIIKIKAYKLAQSELAITQTDLQKLADKNYNFINGNILTFSCNKLSSIIGEIYPIYSGVNCQKDYRNQTITIGFEQNPAELIWTSGNQSYTLDANGRSINLIHTKTELNGLIEVFDKTNLPISLGQQVTTDQFIEFINQLNKADQEQLDFVDFEKYNIEESIEELIVQTNHTVEIRFNSSRSAEVQIENLLKVLRDKPIEQIRQYIDLRIPNRVYYY